MIVSLELPAAAIIHRFFKLKPEQFLILTD